MGGNIKVTVWQSPAGGMLIGSYGGRLCLCDWTDSSRSRANIARICRALGAMCARGATDVAALAVAQLEEYFAGRRRYFTIPTRMVGTDFQLDVWNALADVGYGHTLSYAELSRAVGRPTAVRAVATAVASNPLSIIVPCHRVIGSDGRLTGYAGGLHAKAYLLSLESKKYGRQSPGI